MFPYSIRAAVLQYPSSHNCANIILQEKMCKDKKKSFMNFFPIFYYLSVFEDCVSSHVFISTCPNIQNRQGNCSIAGLQTVEHHSKAELLKSPLDTCGPADPCEAYDDGY